MRAHVYTFEDPDRQTVAYRGYVMVYSEENVRTKVNCKLARRNRLKAMEDAKKLIIKIRNGKSIPSMAYTR